MGRLREKSKNLYLLFLCSTTLLFLWFSTKEEPRDFTPRLTAHVSSERHVEHTRFAINRETCKILEFLEYHPTILKHADRNFEKLVCSSHSPLTEASGVTLVLRTERISNYASEESLLKCFYQGIVRLEDDAHNYTMKSDRRYILKESVPIKASVTPISEDGILVNCEESGRTVYKNVHYFIQPKRAQKKRQTFKKKSGQRALRPDKLSVIFMGTDSVSRANLQRLMPKTYIYLTKMLHAIDFRGFNKIGDNTKPNVLAMLMGMTKDELQKHKCQTERMKSRLDNCPFIWKNFSEKGYVTVYGEDLPEMWAFHNDSPGFVKKPTDYYIRPYAQASDEIIGHAGGSKFERNVCQGPSMTMSVVHDYSLKVAEALRDIPYFGWYWTTSLTHDALNAAALADEPSLDYLKKLHNGGYLGHSILFFISDHGLRFGDFRSTYAGMLEERLPYMLVVLPGWLKKRFPKAVTNMRINAGRLTSTFDIYATLRTIVDQTYFMPRLRPKKGYGQSLFTQISPYRTCEDANIPEHFCSCEQSKEMDPSDHNLLRAAKATLGEVNAGLAAFPDCATLQLDKVVSGRTWSARNNTSFGNFGKAVTSYLVVFTATPGGAMLEATVKQDEKGYKLAFEASRINKFGNQSHCISDPLYKSYCYCKDLLT